MNTIRSQVRVTKIDHQSFGMAMWACWIYILVAVGRVNELIPGLDRVPVAKFAVVLWAFALLSKRNVATYQLRQMSFFKIFFWLLVLGCSSLLFSIWPGATLAFLIGPGVALAVTIFLFGKTVTSWPAARAVVSCLVFAGAGLAIQGFRSYAGGRLVVESMYDPNDLAYVLITVLPLTGALAWLGKGWQRAMFFAFAILLVAVIFLTQSRGAFLALIAEILFLVIMVRGANRGVVGRGRQKKPVLVLIVAVLAIFGALWTVLPDDARNRIATVFSLSSDYNTDENNTTGRISIWKRNFAAVLQRPIGHGLNSSEMVDLNHGGMFKAIHNTPLQLSVELGVLGFILVCRAHWLLWKDLRNVTAGKIQEPLEKEQLVITNALRLAMIGNIVSGFFLSMAYSNMLWILLALIAMTVAVLRGPPKNASAHPPQKSYGAPRIE